MAGLTPRGVGLYEYINADTKPKCKNLRDAKSQPQHDSNRGFGMHKAAET